MNVREIQTALKQLGIDPGPIDGIRGNKTIAAIKEFQRRYGLLVDGIAGPQTQTALKRALEAPKTNARPEPDKSAINSTASSTSPGLVQAAPPPNVSSLKLLDTGRSITEIIIHCTATPEGKDYTVNDIRSWHKQRGFSDVGYHYIVYRDGRVMIGRPIGQIGAHVEGHNTGTIGISYIGGLSSDGKTAKDTRTEAQKKSLLWLTSELAKKFKVKKITGHNQYANKACPSFDVRKDPLGAIV